MTRKKADLGDKFAGAFDRLEQPAPVPAPPSEPDPSEDVRMLGGRVPDSVFRAFGKAKDRAEEEMRVRKVTTEQGLEALVHALKRPEVWEAWVEELDRFPLKRQK